MAKMTRLRRLATVSAAGALLASTLPATFAPASASHTYIRDLESGCPSDRVPDYGFTDVDEGATHEFTINCLVWYGITVGTGDGTTYSPGVITRRGQMAAFLYRQLDAANVPLNDNAPTAFEDVEGTFFETQINALAEIGVVFGEPDTDDYDGDGDTSEMIYKPSAEMDRGRMAAFINNVHEAATGTRMTSSNDYFTDDNGNEFEDDINGLAENGVVTGKTDTTYEPDSLVPRGAMGSFLSRESDHLVDVGVLRTPVNGAADIILDRVDVQQGRSLEGLVYIDESDEVASLVVDGCSVNSESVPVDADNRFSVNIPLEQPATQCQLVFDVTLVDSQTEQEVKQITVTETDKYLAGPTLVSVEVTDDSGDSVTIRFEFDEAVNDDAIVAGNFVLNSFDGSASSSFGGNSAVAVTENVVDVTWTGDAAASFQNMTTVSLTKFAVQDLDAAPNVEFSAGVQAVELSGGETSRPDLEEVTGNGNNWLFKFDQTAYNVADDPSDGSGDGFPGSVDESTDPSMFHLILSNGQDIAAETVSGSGTSQYAATFAIAEGFPVAAYIEAGAIAGEAEQIGPGTNPRQGVVVTGRQGSDQLGPNLNSQTIDAASNSVQFTFGQAVTSNQVRCGMFDPPTCSDFTPDVRLYDIFGNEFGATSVTSGPSGNQVTATFDADTPWELIAGGSIGEGSVTASGSGEENDVQGFGITKTFQPGETAAPDLVSISKSSSTNEDGEVTQITYSIKIDQAFDFVSDGSGNGVLLYAYDQTSLNIEGGCTVDDELNELVCNVTGDDIAFAANAVYLSIVPGTLNEDGDSANRTNYASGAQV